MLCWPSFFSPFCLSDSHLKHHNHISSTRPLKASYPFKLHRIRFDPTLHLDSQLKQSKFGEATKHTDLVLRGRSYTHTAVCWLQAGKKLFLSVVEELLIYSLSKVCFSDLWGAAACRVRPACHFTAAAWPLTPKFHQTRAVRPCSVMAAVLMSFTLVSVWASTDFGCVSTPSQLRASTADSQDFCFCQFTEHNAAIHHRAARAGQEVRHRYNIKTSG